jgi:hypothetical protein
LEVHLFGIDAIMIDSFSVFDKLLLRKQNEHDILQYPEVQQVLREGIVNPFHENLYVSSKPVMELRKLLDELSSVKVERLSTSTWRC